MSTEKQKAGGSGRIQSKIQKCICLHTWQDSQYGKQMRIHRMVPEKQGSGFIAKCTVCVPTRAQLRSRAYILGKSLGATGRLG